MRQAGRRGAQALFDWDRQIQAYEDLFARLLER